ncbi:MAG: class A beta-lactamase [Pseudomonadota bacterium]
MMPRRLFALAMLILHGCATPIPTPTATTNAELARIEAGTGGRLGVALMDGRGTVLLSHRAHERFAMCSTMKLPLAAMVIDAVERGEIDGALPLSITQANVTGHAPSVVAALGAGRTEMTIGEAAEAAVVTSDNGAANLLLGLIGGPEGFTQAMRAWGDSVTRLDRIETALNSNVPGDPRDTATPAATTGTVRAMFGPALLREATRQRLREWTTATTTGARRVRAGLSALWLAGDKTGTCASEGQPNPEYNDIGWFRDAAGEDYYFTAYLDHPTVGYAEAEAALAQAGRVMARAVWAVPNPQS